MTDTRWIGAIETGGTKVICAIAESSEHVARLERFPTGTDPSATLTTATDWLVEVSGGNLAAVGIGSFGPCDPDPASPTFGHVLTTPKPGWAGVDVVGGVRAALCHHSIDVPLAFDTDVNAALVGETRRGAAQGLRDAVYLTVGTGIGGGALVGGEVLHGLLHPEMGHIRVPRQPGERPDFTGTCPYHGDCWEGLASGPAIQARWGVRGEELGPDHPAWDLEVAYLAVGLHAIVYLVVPQRIVLGGGVGLVPHLVDRVRPLLATSLAGYLDVPALRGDLSEYVVGPGLPDRSGIVGALCLAEDLLTTRRRRG